MTDNTLEDIYSAPKSDVSKQNYETKVAYYAPADFKFWILMFFSLGLYNLYWFYKNWALLKANEDLDVWPVPRAIFSIFFVSSLFTHMHDDANEYSTYSRPNPVLWAAFFIIVVIAGRILEKTDPEGWLSLIGLLSVIPLYLFNKCAREINFFSSPDAPVDENFTALNWLVIVLGLVFWALIFTAILIPEAYLE